MEAYSKRLASVCLEICLAALIGVLTGALTALFGRVLIALSNFRDQHIMYLLAFLPLVGLAIACCYKRWGKNAGRGMALVFDRAEAKEEKIDERLIPMIMISTWAGHLFGASVGREGVAVQMGACLADAAARATKKVAALKDLFHAEDFVFVGMAAGFAGLFGTPFAAVAFALELVHPKKLELQALLPAAVAAGLATFTSSSLGLESLHVIMPALDITADNLWRLVLLGLVLGIGGSLFARALSFAKAATKKHFANVYVRMAVLSVVATILLYALFVGRYAGLGTNLITASITGGTIYPWDFAVKAALTILCLAAGFQGGEVTPLFAIGASLAATVAPALGLDPLQAAALGYAALFAAATNSLIAPMLIGLEVFGPAMASAFILVVAVSYIVNGDVSIYPQRKL